MRFMGCSGSKLHNEKKEGEGDQPESKESVLNLRLKNLLKSKRPDDLLSAFLYLERCISEEENDSPSSVFGEAMARQHHIKAHLQMAVQDKNQNEFFSEECSMTDLFIDLGLRNDKIAAEHEEFVARINRRALNKNAIAIWQDALTEVETRIKESSRKIRRLQSAYQQQEELLSKILGNSYYNEIEKKLEKELDKMRYYRDMLSIGILQWEACLNNIEEAARLAKEGFLSWESARNQAIEQKINSATESRDSIFKAVLLIQSSEELLQDVQFPYCTTRELKGIQQAVDYIFTDILIVGRYLHAMEVYKNFFQRATSLYEWMKEVLNLKLKMDSTDIENKISDLSDRLRSERMDIICKKLKIEHPMGHYPNGVQPAIGKAYTDRSLCPSTSRQLFDFPANLESKFHLDPSLSSENKNVENYFQKIVENRKSVLWPSRRIDELQSFTVH